MSNRLDVAAYLYRDVLPVAYSLLPPAMASAEASAFLLSIALQESKCRHRLQIRGPARGFYQFERSGGIAGVLAHRASKPHIEKVLDALCYRPSGDECYRAVADNDVLATCFARLLLWTLPSALPGRWNGTQAWQQYLDAWRPGKPHPETWFACYADGWKIATDREQET